MSAATIRTAIKAQLLTIPGLGGTPTPPATPKVHRYAFLSDDVAETRAFWETVESFGAPPANVPVINGAMITRESREDVEHLDGKEFAVKHEFRILFRYGRLAQQANEPSTEERFEELADAILDKLRGNAAVFQTAGVGGQLLHPQPFADQVARGTMRSVKLFGTRVWETDIRLTVVEHVFISA